jgi:hypothetical protein
MNQRYFAAGIVLIIGALVSFQTTRNLSERGAAARAEHERLNGVLEQDRHTTEVAIAKFSKASGQRKLVEQFLSEWGLLAEDGANNGAIVEKLSKLAYDRNLIASRRPTPTRTDYPLGASIATVQVVGFSVTGNYSSVIDWLGAVETAYPYARLENVALHGRTSDVDLEVTLAFLLGATAAPQATK